MGIDRRWIVLGTAGGIAVAVVIFAVGFFLGGQTSSSVEEIAAPSSATTSTASSASTTLGDPTKANLPEPEDASGTIDPYGSQADRDEFVKVVRNSGIVSGSTLDLLASADEICYQLERLQAQNRTAAYAVRVVWNEALAPLEPEDLAAFGTVFVAAPHYLCPDSAAYAEEVSYWLGY